METVVLVGENGDEMVIHAMTARKKYPDRSRQRSDLDDPAQDGVLVEMEVAGEEPLEDVHHQQRLGLAALALGEVLQIQVRPARGGRHETCRTSTAARNGPRGRLLEQRNRWLAAAPEDLDRE